MISRVVQAEDRSSSCPADDGDACASTSRRAARRRRVHDPDRRAGVGRHARVGLDDDRGRRGPRAATTSGSATRTPRPRRRDARSTTRSPPSCAAVDALALGAIWLGDGRRAAQRRPAGDRLRWRSSAVDTALWDLQGAPARACRSTLAARRAHDRVPVYGSGGFCSYSVERLAEQLGGWVEQGIPRVKMKVGREPERDPARLDAAREAIGDDASSSSTRTARSRASRRSAGRAATTPSWDVRWFEEPVSSADLDGLRLIRDRGPAGLDVAAGEYALRARRLPQRSRRRGRLPAGRRHPLRRDHRLAARRRALRRARARPLRRTARPSSRRTRSAASTGCGISSTSTTTCGSSAMLFDGVLEPVDGALGPTARGPGNGLELKRAGGASGGRPDRAPAREHRARGAMQKLARRATALRRAAARASRSTSSTTRARSATSGCGRRCC